jgi:hypothetical protein
MVDMVVPRTELRATLSNICRILTKTPLVAAVPLPVEEVVMPPQTDDVTAPASA